MTSSNENILPRYWPFVRGIHQSPVKALHKDRRRGVLMFSLICPRTNVWVNSPDAGDLRRHRAHYDVTVFGKMDHLLTRPRLIVDKLNLVLSHKKMILTMPSARYQPLPRPQCVYGRQPERPLQKSFKVDSTAEHYMAGNTTNRFVEAIIRVGLKTATHFATYHVNLLVKLSNQLRHITLRLLVILQRMTVTDELILQSHTWKLLIELSR